MRRRRAVRQAFAALAVAGSLTGPVRADPLTLTAEPVGNFLLGADTRNFGRLKFISGLKLSSADRRFGGFSGIRFASGRERFIAISDTGNWLAASIRRDDRGAPAGIVDAVIEPLPIAGRRRSKSDVDAEALELAGTQAFVAYERRDRIEKLRFIDGRLAPPATVLADLAPLDLENNRGIEALTTFPANSDWPGHLLAIAEESPDAAGNHRAFILGEGEPVPISLLREPGFAITDAAFLPDGDLLVLERGFSLISGVTMRLSLFRQHLLKPGAVAIGKTLLRASSDHRIDNMEGLAISSDADGRTFLTLISDDNFASYQETLLLEFELLP